MVIGHYTSSWKYETEAFIARRWRSPWTSEHCCCTSPPAVTRRAGELLSGRDLAVISIYRLESILVRDGLASPGYLLNTVDNGRRPRRGGRQAGGGSYWGYLRIHSSLHAAVSASRFFSSTECELLIEDTYCGRYWEMIVRSVWQYDYDWTDYVANVVTNKLILTPLLYSRIIFDNNRIHL